MIDVAGWNNQIALLIAAIACITDLKCRKIPNWLTFPGMIAGIGCHLIAAESRWSFPLLGIGLGLALLLIPFAAGGMGAGDVKLLMALGAFVGPQSLLWLFLYAGVAGGIFSLGYMAYRLGLLGMLLRVKMTIESIWNKKQRALLRAVAAENQLHIPYGVAVFAGALVELVIR